MECQHTAAVRLDIRHEFQPAGVSGPYQITADHFNIPVYINVATVSHSTISNILNVSGSDTYSVWK